MKRGTWSYALSAMLISLIAALAVSVSGGPGWAVVMTFTIVYLNSPRSIN